MSYLKKLFPIIFLFVLFGCGSESPGNDKSTIREKAANNLKASKAPKIESKITVVPALPVLDEKTGIPNTKIYISSPDFPELLYLVNDFDCAPMNPDEIRRLSIPLEANFLFKSIYKENGTYYYGLINDDNIELYGQTVEKARLEVNPKSKPFNLIRKFDVKNRPPLDGFFICFKEDRQKELNMSIYYDVQGMANSIKFEKKNVWIPLQYNTSQVDNKGAMPTTIDQYFEIVKGAKNGILNLTHVGNWDYASYTNTQDGKELNFTIDHEASIVDDSYRKDPCF